MSKVPLFISFIFIASCGVKQPLDLLSDSTDYGSVFVNSEPAGASIYLDNLNSHKFTPDTLFNILTGQHSLQVIKDGYLPSHSSFLISVVKDSLLIVLFELQAIEQWGYLFTKSTPSGAEIYIDDQATGKITPDTLKLEPGNHQLSLHKNGYMAQQKMITVIRDSILIHEFPLQIQPRVLLESFANVSCVPCVEATQNLLEFYSKTAHEQFAIIEYFANWPNPNDPFYKVSPADVNARVQYYEVATLPNLRMNGTKNPNASEMTEIDQNFSEAFNSQNSTIGLSLSKLLVDGQLRVKVQIYFSENPISSVDWRLFVAITEDQIHFDTPPGSNGLRDFDFVFRKFLTGKNGEPISTNADELNFEYFLDWPEWNYSNCHVIAFIQNFTNKQIFQTTIH